MRIRQSHEIAFKGRLIGLLESRCRKGSRDKQSRCRIRVWRWLVWVQRTAVVLGRTELVSAGGQLTVTLAGAADGVVGRGKVVNVGIVEVAKRRTTFEFGDGVGNVCRGVAAAL